MSDAFLGSRDVVIRKPCRCDGCLLRYKPGTQIQKSAHKTDGEFQETCLCPTCKVIILESGGAYRDGFGLGEIREENEDWEETRARIGAPMGAKEGGAK